MCIDGFGVHKTIVSLNSKGIKPPRSKSWARTTISKILTNKAVLGEYQHYIKRDGKRVPVGEPEANFFPSIIEENIFYLAQSKRESRRLRGGGQRGNTFSNLFHSIPTCSKCGSNIVYKSKGNGLNYLTCSNRIHQLCDHKPLRYEYALRFIVDVYLSPQYASNWFSSAEQKAPVVSNTEALEAQLKDAETSLNSLLEATVDFSNDIIQAQIQKRSASIEALRQEVETAKQQQADTETDVFNSAEEARQLIADAFQKTLYPLSRAFKTVPQELEEEDIYKKRVKLNRVLSKAFPELVIEHNNDSLSFSTAESIYIFEEKNWVELATPDRAFAER